MKKKIIGVLIAAVIVIAAAGILILNFINDYREKNRRSEVVMSLQDYYKVPDGEAMVIIDEKVYEKNALWRNETAYLDLDTVKTMYIHRFFWVPEENTMFYSAPGEVFRFTPGNREYLVNEIAQQSEAPIVELRDGMPYISVKYLENCGITYSVYTDPARVLITYSSEAYLAATVREKTQIRVSQDIKADLLTELEVGETVRFIDGGGIRENGFVKVMDSKGVRGYIMEADLNENYYQDPVFVDFTWPEYPHTTYSDKVYLGWQLLYTTDSVGMLKDELAKAPEMNVISPTWFFMSDTDGNMINYASKAYVDEAHSRGVKVWALYKNDTIEGKFNCTEDSHAVLSSTAARTNLINNIISTAVEYDLDGVNIDYEMLKVDSGVFFIQFLRELSVKCRERGLVLSVDNYVPENYNAYYDIAEQSRVVDYIIIMGYDQHYAGSEEAGSVSALDWFSNALGNTAAKADMSRVIMGVPFYTRLWKINNGSLYVEETLSMAGAEKKVNSIGAEKNWKNDEGQYYAEWTSGENKFKIWLEDIKSLQAKTYAAREYGAAGIAAWKCGDETSDTWAAIKDALEGEIPEPEEDEEDGADE